MNLKTYMNDFFLAPAFSLLNIFISVLTYQHDLQIWISICAGFIGAIGGLTYIALNLQAIFYKHKQQKHQKHQNGN